MAPAGDDHAVGARADGHAPVDARGDQWATGAEPDHGQQAAVPVQLGDALRPDDRDHAPVIPPDPEIGGRRGAPQGQQRPAVEIDQRATIGREEHGPRADLSDRARWQPARAAREQQDPCTMPVAADRDPVRERREPLPAMRDPHLPELPAGAIRRTDLRRILLIIGAEQDHRHGIPEVGADPGVLAERPSPHRAQLDGLAAAVLAADHEPSRQLTGSQLRKPRDLVGERPQHAHGRAGCSGCRRRRRRPLRGAARVEHGRDQDAADDEGDHHRRGQRSSTGASRRSHRSGRSRAASAASASRGRPRPPPRRR